MPVENAVKALGTPEPLVLHCATHEYATIYPVTTDDTAGVRRFCGGIAVNGSIMPDSLLWRGRKHVLRPIAPETQPTPQCGPDRALYGGWLIDSFGHFLLESLSRLWAAKVNPDLPIVWTRNNDPHCGSVVGYTSWQREILDILGIHNLPIFVDHPTTVKRLFIPDVGFRMPDFYSDAQRHFLGVVDPSPARKGLRCWISRTRLPADFGRVEGEKIIEEQAIRLGWVIYHPQEHSVREQLEFLSSCEMIAGWEASAFHSLVLLKSLQTEVHIFARGEHLSETYITIADRQNFHQEAHEFPMEFLGGRGKRMQWRPQNPADPVDALCRIHARC